MGVMFFYFSGKGASILISLGNPSLITNEVVNDKQIITTYNRIL